MVVLKVVCCPGEFSTRRAVTAQDKFLTRRTLLRERLKRERRAATPAEYAALCDDLEAWELDYQEWHDRGRPMPPGVFVGRSPPPPRLELEIEFAPTEDEEPPAEPARRQGQPDPIPVEKIEKLERELKDRRAAGNPTRGQLTQTNIAERLGLDRHRVAQAEGLLGAGWDLLASRPDVAANDGYVRWPSVEDAEKILASERSRRRVR